MVKISDLNDIPSVKSYLIRIGAEARSLRTAVVKENLGKYWKDLAIIHFWKDGKVESSVDEYAPTEKELESMGKEIPEYDFPQLKPIARLVKPPKMIKDAEAEDVFEFRDDTGHIVMVQVRVDRDGDKGYIPWTYWDDDKWRCAEPDGPLPFFNADKLKEEAAVFIHEGAKAARAMQTMIEGVSIEARKALAEHPWGQELMGAVHIGWIGGALSPYRTDWRQIAKEGIRRAYIVADNDTPGRAAVPAISKQLRIPTFVIQFTDEFPASFDLADKFPDRMFGTVDDVRSYIGPAFRECLHPATWATDLVPNPKGKPTPVLRDSFKAMWAYIEEADLFVCTEMTDIIRTEPILNKMLAGFSHAAETTRLIMRAWQGRSARICYRPDESGLLVTFRGSSAINLHTPTTIKPVVGNPKPFLDFIDYMFVNEDEKNEIFRWCATLIARPDIRMGYGVLLVSERQGIGKTTLGAAVLAPLVGKQNASYPGEKDIANSAFNGWVANKRLVVVNEIYSGSSWKAYHALKGIITDREVDVNQKFQRPYTIENWAHVFACSNSLRALKMENDDRRWLYPEVTENPWQEKQFMEFRNWLANGGLGIIFNWAKGYGDYVRPAERAPMTERKRELIEGSRSEAQTEAVALAEQIVALDRPASVMLKDVTFWVRAAVQGKVYDSDYEIRRAMVEAGLKAWKRRVKVSGRLQYALVNSELWDDLARLEANADQNAMIREYKISPGELIENRM